MNLSSIVPALRAQPRQESKSLEGNRAGRRAAERAQQRRRRKAQRDYVRREWAREREVSDLANLFAIVDGKVPTQTPGDPRAYAAIDARVNHLQEKQREAGQEIEDHNAIVDRLRDLAATGRG